MADIYSLIHHCTVGCRNMFKKSICSFICWLCLVGSAQSCFIPPPELTKHHTSLVRQTDNIILAKAQGRSGKFGEIWSRDVELTQFTKLEEIKGTASTGFTIENGFISENEDIGNRDFDSHRNLTFWEKQVTRQWNMSDCIMRPRFQIGHDYLLFLGKSHWRAYEEIISPDDLWLKAVRELVANPSLTTGLKVSLEEWLLMANGVFIGTVDNCEGPTLNVNEVVRGEFDNKWAYSNNEDPGYWPFEECTKGKEYVVVTLLDKQLALPYYSSTLFEVLDGTIDVSFRKGSEIEIDQRVVEIEMIKNFF